MSRHPDEAIQWEPENWEWGQPITVWTIGDYAFSEVYVDIYSSSQGWMTELTGGVDANGKFEHTFYPVEGMDDPGDVESIDLAIDLIPMARPAEPADPEDFPGEVEKAEDSDTFDVDPMVWIWGTPMTITARDGYLIDTVGIDVNRGDGWELGVQDMENTTDPHGLKEFTFSPGRGVEFPGSMVSVDVMVTTMDAPKPIVEIETEEIAIPYDKVTEEDPNEWTVYSEVTQEGVEGVETVTWEVTYLDGVEVSREEISRERTLEPVTEITTVGTNPNFVTFTRGNSIRFGATVTEEDGTIHVIDSKINGSIHVPLGKLTLEITPGEGRDLIDPSITGYDLINERNYATIELDNLVAGQRITVSADSEPLPAEETITLYPLEVSGGGTAEVVTSSGTDKVSTWDTITVLAGEDTNITSIDLELHWVEKQGFFDKDHYINASIDNPSNEELFRWRDHFTQRNINIRGLTISVGTESTNPDRVVYSETLENAKSSWDRDYITPSDKVTYTANEGFEISNIEILVDGVQWDNLDIQELSHTVDFNFLVIENENVEVVVSTQVYYPLKRFAPELVNATTNIDPEIGIKQTDTLVVTANDGYIFNDPIRMTFVSSTVHETDRGVTFFPNESTGFNEDNTVLTIDMSEHWLGDYNGEDVYVQVILNATASEPQETSVAGNFVNVYKANQETLDTLSRERWYQNLDRTEVYDFGQYIYALYSVPMKLPERLIGNDIVPVNLATVDTTATALPILANRFTFDLGEIHVPEEYGNVYDYVDTETILQVPFNRQPIAIDPNYVIGQTIKIGISLDLYNGEATLDILSSKIEYGLVQRVDIPLTHDIPFTQRREVVNKNTIGNYVNNHIDTSFIEVVRNIPYDRNSTFGKAMIEYGRVGDYSGYLEMDDTNVVTNATSTEQEMIKAELASGVIIK